MSVTGDSSGSGGHSACRVVWEGGKEGEMCGLPGKEQCGNHVTHTLFP